MEKLERRRAEKPRIAWDGDARRSKAQVPYEGDESSEEMPLPLAPVTQTNRQIKAKHEKGQRKWRAAQAKLDDVVSIDTDQCDEWLIKDSKKKDTRLTTSTLRVEQRMDRIAGSQGVELGGKPASSSRHQRDRQAQQGRFELPTESRSGAIG